MSDDSLDLGPRDLLVLFVALVVGSVLGQICGFVILYLVGLAFGVLP